jgi:hypothetical protein
MRRTAVGGNQLVILRRSTIIDPPQLANAPGRRG